VEEVADRACSPYAKTVTATPTLKKMETSSEMISVIGYAQAPPSARAVSRPPWRPFLRRAELLNQRSDPIRR
jgi:hypothetical protein